MALFQRYLHLDVTVQAELQQQQAVGRNGRMDRILHW
jgi:hypothetical protein